ncbi:hypothetical protein [Fodinibius sediminis]|nr:hypothetical protein [Fodinibius sediminis]
MNRHIMADFHRRLRAYYVNGHYRGFYKTDEKRLPMAGITILAFSNGRKQFRGAGRFTEEALEVVFRQIDRCYAKKRCSRAANQDEAAPEKKPPDFSQKKA